LAITGRNVDGRIHMDFSHSLRHHEPSDRFLHRSAEGEQTVVAEDAELPVAERGREALAAIDRKHLNFLIVEECLVEHESARLLTERAKRLDVSRPWRAEGGVGANYLVEVVVQC